LWVSGNQDQDRFGVFDRDIGESRLKDLLIKGFPFFATDPLRLF